MSIGVRFYTFSKERNSTKTITTEGFTYYVCEFDEPVNFFTPAIRLNATLTVVLRYTYVYIPSLTRYYFIDSWTYTDGMYHARLSLDVLASHKTEILATKQYVVRTADNSATALNTIVDNAVPISADVSVVNTKVNNWFSYSSVSDGCYIVGIINSDSNAIGAVSYYAMSATAFNTIKHYLMTNIDWADIDNTEISKALQKALINPLSYIASVIWLPLTVADCGLSDITSISCGYWTITGITAKRIIPSGATLKTFSVTRSFHPDINSVGAWVNAMPYTEMELHLPPFGNIVIDSLRYPHNTIDIDVTIDLISGKAIMSLYTVNGIGSARTRVFVESHSAVMGVNIALAQTTVDVMGAYSTPTTAIMTGVTAGTTLLTDIIGGEGASNALKTAGQMAIPQQVQTSGSNGGFCDYYLSDRYLVHRFRRVGGISRERNGKPYCKFVTLNTLVGYTLCVNAHFDSNNCYIAEIERISSYLNSGVLIE